MATRTVSICIRATTRHVIWMIGNCLSAQARRLYCVPGRGMPTLPGETSSTTANRTECAAASSETSPYTKAQDSFDRRAQLLTASGLIAGVIPMSMRRLSGHGILAIASSAQDGGEVDSLKTDY